MDDQSGRCFIFRIDLMTFTIKSSIHSLEITSSSIAIVALLYLDCLLSKYLDNKLAFVVVL